MKTRALVIAALAAAFVGAAIAVVHHGHSEHVRECAEVRGVMVLTNTGFRCIQAPVVPWAPKNLTVEVKP